MRTRSMETLVRSYNSLAVPVSGSSWLSLGLFLFLVAHLELHWWAGAFGAAVDDVLLRGTMALSAACSVLFVLGTAFWIKWQTLGRTSRRSERHIVSDTCSAVFYATIAAWCWTALTGSPSPLLGLAALNPFVLIAGVALVTLRRVRRRAA